MKINRQLFTAHLFSYYFYAMKKYISILICLVFLLLQACSTKETDTPDNPSIAGRKVYITNEGAFQNGNASFAVYDIDNDSLYNDVYTNVNNKPLGDVAIAVYADEDQLYIVVNNSNKIVILDKNTFQEKASIAIPQPRYIEFYAPKKAYVSCIYQAKVFVVDFNLNQIIKEIDVDYNRGTEGMLYHQNAMYVCNWDTTCNYIYKINVQTHTIEERLPISGYAPKYVLADNANNLWIISGNNYFQKEGYFTQLSGTTGAILKTIAVPADYDIISPAMHPSKNSIFFNAINYMGGQNGVYQLETSATTFPSTAFIPAANLQYYYAIGIDKNKMQLYIGDPKGFNQSGDIHIYSITGEFIKSLKTGVGPSYFYFDEN